MSDASFCRDKGWKVGTRLIGAEGGRDWKTTTTIELTAIGESNILAKTIASVSYTRDGWYDPWEENPSETLASIGMESLWTLSCRDWKEVCP